jgi:hypothetical protein
MSMTGTQPPGGPHTTSKGQWKQVGRKGRQPRADGEQATTGSTVTAKVFVGREADLGSEYVYAYTDGRNASDQYTRTTEEIIRYASVKYSNGGDVERSLSSGKKLTMTTPLPPPKPAVITPITEDEEMAELVYLGEKEMWKNKIKDVLSRIRVDKLG